MNTTLSPVRRDLPPDWTVAQPTRTARRVGILDRAALHLGIALVKWGRRPRPVESHERRANRVELEIARVARERGHELTLRLGQPPR